MKLETSEGEREAFKKRFEAMLAMFDPNPIPTPVWAQGIRLLRDIDTLLAEVERLRAKPTEDQVARGVAAIEREWPASVSEPYPGTPAVTLRPGEKPVELDDLVRTVLSAIAPPAPPLPAESAEGGIVAWNEFVDMSTNPVLGGVMRMKRDDVIQWWRRTHPERAYTDQEALDEFMIVNWAWFEHQAPPLPAEVEEMRKKLDVRVAIIEAFIREINASPGGEHEKLANELRSAASLLSRWPGGWRPISTAPKDVACILKTDGGWVGEAWYSETDEGWWEANTHPTDAHDGRVEDPTGWMPLPNPGAAK